MKQRVYIETTVVSYLTGRPSRDMVVAAHPAASRAGAEILRRGGSAMDAAVEAADRYYPAFDFMIRGNKKPQDAIDSCLFETVGTA
jgi:hypothetical protein